MSQSRPDQSELAIVVSSHKMEASGTRLRSVYAWLVERMTDLGIPPTRVAREPGSRGKFQSFARMRRRIESEDFDQYMSLSLEHLRPERDVRGSNWAFWDWTAEGGMRLERRGNPHLRYWSASWCVFPLDVPIPESDLMPHVLEFARLVIDRYGYICYVRRRANPSLYALGAGGADGWKFCFESHAQMCILRDVYPFNFLSRPYLDLSIGGMSLETWIREEPSRGTLEPFADGVWLWRPPIEEIPAIREALFRAGHILYYEFFRPGGIDYRDWSRPFEPREPIPEPFRAETYAGKDPKVFP